jgi:hypothetical protein
MNTQEIQEQLKDNQEITIKLEARINELEKREVSVPDTQVPDYGNQLMQIKQTIDQIALAATPVKQAEELTEIVNRIVRKLPEKIPAVIKHQIDRKSKGLITGAVILVLTTAICSGLAFSFWRENRRLHDNDIKFRMIRQNYPDKAYWADTTFYKNPDGVEAVTEKLEAEEMMEVARKGKEITN